MTRMRVSLTGLAGLLARGPHGADLVQITLAANRARLGRESARAANVRAVMRDHEPDPGRAAGWDQQAADLNALAQRCGHRPQLNGADPDD